MYYCNYFRSEDPQELDNLNNMHGAESVDFPFCCPYYRQFFLPPPVDFMNRQPYDDPPFDPPPGQQYGPQYGQQPGQQYGPQYGQQPGQQPGQQSGPPMGPPPSATPSKQSALLKSGPSTKAVEPGTLKPCLFRYVYIWPRRGRGFWAWLTYVGRRSIAGYRWDGRRWRYFGMDLREIETFTCY